MKKIFFCVLLLSLSVSASADLMMIKVTGTVEWSTIETGYAPIQEGDQMVGYCTYYLDAIDLDSSAYKGEYELVSMVMQIGDYTFSNSTQNPTLEVWVTDEYYLARCEGGRSLFGDTILDESLTTIRLFDLGNNYINRENDLIPTSIPDASFFTSRNLFTVGLGLSIGGGLGGIIDSIEVIPEPCTILLLGLGGLGVIRRRK